MSKEGSFVRWQAVTITQMGNAVSLILTLATASLGFALTLARDREIQNHGWGRCFVLLGGLSLVMSIGVGIWCVLNRLEDFRTTAQIAHRRETMERQGTEPSVIDQELNCVRCQNKQRGELSKSLLNWQVRLFGAGIGFLSSGFLCVYHQNIF
jgi:hypothetical protein